MDKQQLSKLRICIELWLNTKKIDCKYVWLAKDDDCMAILKKSCTKFEIVYEQAKNEGYIFITKKHLCQISSVEDLVFDDVLMMIPEMEDVGVSNLLDEFQ